MYQLMRNKYVNYSEPIRITFIIPRMAFHHIKLAIYNSLYGVYYDTLQRELYMGTIVKLTYMYMYNAWYSNRIELLPLLDVGLGIRHAHIV